MLLKNDKVLGLRTCVKIFFSLCDNMLLFNVNLNCIYNKKTSVSYSDYMNFYIYRVT